MLQQSYNNPQALIRFQREGKAIALLQHENIVRVYSLQFINQQLPFLVMEIVHGTSLADLLSQSGPMPPPRVAKFMSQICDGLAHAHVNGVIHRDLKPSNVIVVNPGRRNEQIKILDFGIAKIEGDDTAKATQTGDIFGSPAYMSPEQASGQKVDLKTDQYSLGCLAFELLTGRPPFENTNSLSVLMSHINERPPSVSRAAKQHIPTYMENTIQRLLEKNPEDRFPSIMNAKAAFLGEEDGISRTRSWLKLTPKRVAALVAWLTILVGVALGLYRMLEPRSLLFNQLGSRETAGEIRPNKDVLTGWDDDAMLDSKICWMQHPESLDLEKNSKREFTNIRDNAMTAFDSAYSLHDLSLSDCVHLTSGGIAHLVNLPLERLRINATKVDDRGIALINKISHLRYLDFDETPIGNKGLQSLRLPELNMLSMNHTDVTGDGLIYLKGRTKLHDLYANKLRNMHNHLAPLVDLHLERLSLADDLLDATDMRVLARSRTIRILHLTSNPIDGQGLESLANMPKLHVIYAQATPILEADLDRFIKLRPDCIVYYGSVKNPFEKKGSTYKPLPYFH